MNNPVLRLKIAGVGVDCVGECQDGFDGLDLVLLITYQHHVMETPGLLRVTTVVTAC